MSNFFFSKIFPAAFVLVGLMFFAIGCGHVMEAMRTSSWVPVEGVFLAKSVRSSTSRGSDGKSSTSYKPQVRYSYTVDSQEYEGTTLMVGITGYSRPQYAHAAIEEFRVKQPCKVYVDPEDSTKTVLKTGVQPEHFTFLGLGIGLTIVGISVAIFVPYAIRQEEAKKKRIAAYQAASAAKHASPDEHQ